MIESVAFTEVILLETWWRFSRCVEVGLSTDLDLVDQDISKEFDRVLHKVLVTAYCF